MSLSGSEYYNYQYFKLEVRLECYIVNVIFIHGPCLETIYPVCGLVVGVPEPSVDMAQPFPNLQGLYIQGQDLVPFR